MRGLTASHVQLGLLTHTRTLCAASGYVHVNWNKIEQDVRHRLGAADVRATRLQDVLAFNLPGGTGFASGLTFALGGRLGKLAVAGGAVAAGMPLAFHNSKLMQQLLEASAPGVAATLQAVLLQAAARERWRHAPLEELKAEEARLCKELRSLAADKARGAQAARVQTQLEAVEIARRERQAHK